MCRMLISGRTGRFFIGLSVLGSSIALSGTPQALAVDRTWNGATSDFETGSNWVGGTAPANDLTSDTAVFGAKGTLPNPALTMDREIYGMNFQNTGWTLGGAGYTLTVGAGGINTTHTTTSSTTIQPKVALGASATWTLGSASWLNHTLTLSGGLSSQPGQTLTIANSAWYNPFLNITGPASLAGDVVIRGPNLKLANYTASSITGNLRFDGGVLSIDADLARDLGTGGGGIQFTSGRIGGFTNYGNSRITISIGDGAGGLASLQWGSTLFNPSALVLSGLGAETGGLTFANPIDLNRTSGTRVLYNYGGANYTAELAGLISNSGAGSAGIEQHNNSTGVTYLANNANTFNGPITVNGGALRFDTIGSIGSGPSALGNPTTAANALITLGGYHSSGVWYTGTLLYSGSDTVITDRPIRLAGHAAIRSTGAEAITFTADMQPAITDIVRTFTLGGANTGNNTFAGRIVDRSAAYPTSVVKADAGTWVLSGDNTYTGNTTVNAGILRASGTNANTLGTGSSQLILNGGTLESFADTTSTINYARDTTVNANATITLGRLTSGSDTTAARQFGALSIGNATLTARLDPANYTAQYVAGLLTFGDTTLTGNATFNITNLRKGSESQPRLVLGQITDSGAGHGFTATGTWWYSTVFANGGVNVGGNVVLNGTTLRAVGDWSTQHIGGNINLAGGTLQLSGDFTRELGSGPGQIQLSSGTAGFSTYGDGSDVTVNLTDPSTGQPADLVWGSDHFKPGILLLALGTAAPSGQLELVNAVDLYGATRNIYVYAGTAKISGLISNSQATPAGLIKHQYSSGTLWLANNANTFDGPITIQRETLQFDSIGDVDGSPSALGAPTSAANGLINLGITSRPVALRYTGSADSSSDRMIALPGTTGPITITADGTGTIRFTNTSPMPTPGAGAKALTFNGTNTGDNLFAIGIVDNNSTNTTRVVKSGTGTWILSGTNTYSGPTSVNAGTLLVNGTHTGGGAYTVASNATLGGTGTIGGATTVNSGAFLAPGASIGMLTFSNDLALQASSTLLWEFLEAGAAGDHYDSITGPKLVLPETGKVNLSISALAGYQLSAGDSFTLFHGDVFEHGAAEPFAFGTNLNDYFQITDNIGWWGTWELTAGSLVLTAVPEPGTWLMLICGLAFGLLVRRRRCCAGVVVVLAALWAAPQSPAAERIWISTSSTDFENAANWGGTAPANNLIDDTAVFDAKGSLVNPSLTTDREIHAIKFTDGGWTLGGAANTLSVGAGGVNYISNSTTANVITANIELAVDSTWIISRVSSGSNRTLQVDGVISGPGGLTKTYTTGTSGNVYATLKLTALNTYTGQTILDQGGMTNVLDFNSIGNVGGGPSALGAPTTVENGTIKLISQVAPKYTGTGHATDRRIELAGAGGHAMLYAEGSGPLVWNGDVVVTGTGDKVLSLRGNSSAANTFNGLIADGTVPLRFQIYGTGHWTLANDNNSWTGDTRVAYGTLTVTSLADAGFPSALGAATGSNALIKLGTGNYHGTLKYVGTGHSTNRPVQLGDSSGSGAGTIEANGTGALVFTGNFTGINNGTAKTLTLGGTSDPGLLNTISGVIADGNTAEGRTTSLVKSGGNTWVLSGDNTYTGTTGVNAGTLIITHPGALGSSAPGSGTTVADGAVVRVQGGITVAEPIAVTASDINWSGALQNAAGNNEWSGPITFSGYARVGVASGTVFTLSGGVYGSNAHFGSHNGIIRIVDNPISISPTGTVTALNNSTVELNVGGNTWGNTIMSNGGTLKLGLEDAIPTTAIVSVGGTNNTNGTFDLNGHNQTIAGLRHQGTATVLRVVNSGSGTPTLTVNNADDYTYGGVLGIAGQSGFSLTKKGNGTLTLSGDNAFTGPTTVEGGTLALSHASSNNISGSQLVRVDATGTLDVTGLGGGKFAVAAGQTLGGRGTVHGAVDVLAAAALSPGMSLGTLSLTGDLTLHDGAEWIWEFLEAGAAGDDYDSIAGPKLVLPETGTVNLNISALAGYQLSAGDSFTLFQGDVFEHGAAEPFAFGTNLNDYFHVTDNIGWWGTWELTAGSLVLAAVPEPGTWLMLMCALAFGLMVRRPR